jgi:hypothetical protein
MGSPTSSNYDVGFSVVVDSNGNTSTTGTFQGTVDMDSGPGVMNLTAVHFNDT